MPGRWLGRTPHVGGLIGGDERRCPYNSRGLVIELSRDIAGRRGHQAQARRALKRKMLTGLQRLRGACVECKQVASREDLRRGVGFCCRGAKSHAKSPQAARLGDVA